MTATTRVPERAARQLSYCKRCTKPLNRNQKGYCSMRCRYPDAEERQVAGKELRTWAHDARPGARVKWFEGDLDAICREGSGTAKRARHLLRIAAQLASDGFIRIERRELPSGDVVHLAERLP